MANIIQRITTWAAGQVLKSADLDGEFNNVVNLFNNLNSASTSWTNFTATGTVVVPNAAASNQAVAFGQVSGQRILQQVQVTETTADSTTGTSFSTTSLTGSITPASTSSKIKVSVSGVGGSDTSGNPCYYTIYRGATNLGNSTAGMSVLTVNAGGFRVPLSLVYLDSPATTSSITYAVYFRSGTNGDTARFNFDTNTAVLLMEEIG